MQAVPEQNFAMTVQRARAEFLEMPGLTLTPAQAARLWSIDLETSQQVLAELVAIRFLIATPGNVYIRA